MSTVPDSQPSRYEAQGSWGYVAHPDLGPSIIIQGMSTSLSRHGLEAPSPDTKRVAKRRKLDRPDHLVALNQLQQYSSYRDDESSIRNIDLPAHGNPAQPSYHSSPSTTRPPSLPDEYTPLELSTPRLPTRDLDARHQSDGHKRPTDVDGKSFISIFKANAKVCVLQTGEAQNDEKRTQSERQTVQHLALEEHNLISSDERNIVATIGQHTKARNQSLFPLPFLSPLYTTMLRRPQSTESEKWSWIG